MIIKKIDDIFKVKQGNHEIMLLKGYEEIETLFCDSSGFGSDGEMALTKTQLEKKIAQLLAIHSSMHAFITNAGQFQVYITLYKKTGKSKVKTIAGNTYRIEMPNGYTIKYHNTDIVTYKNGAYTLKNGGWYTKTTKERINNEIYPHYISQKNFKWYINKNGIIIPFEEGITI